ncbi:hypothetical protein C0389_02905 [bacterium]|nr:hypothetical protein [bacterium]
MKTASFLIVILLSTNSLFAQDGGQKIFTNFETGFYVGTNFSSISNFGPSFLIEEKTSLSANLNAKFSIGYSRSFQLNPYQNKFYLFAGNYQAYSYEDVKKEYVIIPVTLGLEYILKNDIVSPYCLIDLGYNNYTTTFHSSKWILEGNYDSYDQIPLDYKNKMGDINNSVSYRLGLGIGTRYYISSAIIFDVRYSYQFNTVVVDNHQFLIGFNYSY